MTRIAGGSIIAVALLTCAGTIPAWSAPDQSGLLVRQLMSMWESGDTAALDAITTDDVVYDDVPNGTRFEGRDGVRRYIRHVHSWASQVEVTVTAVHSGPDSAVAEWVMRGVQDRPIPGRVPLATGRAFTLPGVTLVELRDGRIARAADYIDVLGFVVQLGSRVELPGGVVIGLPLVASPDPLATVRRYQDLMRRHDIDGLLALHTADAEFVFPDQQVIRGTDGLRSLHEWDQALATQLELDDLRVIGNEVVVGSLIERNDWFRALGLAEVRYQPGTRFLIRNGQIAGIRAAALSPATQQLFARRFTALLNWLEANHAGVRDRLLPGGHFEYSAANARLWLELMAEWNCAGAPASARGQDEHRAPREYGHAERHPDAQAEIATADREREP